jgi:hypothetical protein
LKENLTLWKEEEDGDNQIDDLWVRFWWSYGINYLLCTNNKLIWDTLIAFWLGRER